MSCTQKHMSLISRMHFIHNSHGKSHILSKQKITKFHEHLIMGVTSSGVDALSTPLSLAVYQSLKEILWYCLPLCHVHTGQMCMIGGWGIVTSKSTSRLVPCMLNGAQIWRIRWPIRPVVIVLPKKVCNNSDH